ncbi:MAG: magnesium transporter [Planctomycetales bacterium]
MSQSLPSIPELKFETASEHHTRAVPVASSSDSVETVIASLRGKRFDSASQIIVCEAEDHLLGVVNLEDLLAAADGTTLAEIMDPEPPVVMPGLDQELAAWKAIRHRQTGLAVVDAERRFQGLISARRMFEVLLWEHDEDTARLGGILAVGATAHAASDEPVPRRLIHRLPWLLAGLLGAVLSADLVGAFEAKLETHLILAFFVPGIVYLADAVGTQTETLVVRGLSVGVRIERVFRREIVTGLLIGLVLASLLYPVIAWRWQRPDVAAAVSIALFAACSIASTIAMALPWALNRLGQDPAFAAGPLATVVQDLLSVLIYFLVCLAIV